MASSSYIKATNRTRNKIRKAFTELLAERGAVKNISITEIAERAEITRGTFYNHYANIYEVGAELQAEIEEYINKVFSYLISNEDLYRQLLSSNAPDSFLNRIENEVSQRIIAFMKAKSIADKSIEMELILMTSGIFSIIRKYFRNETGIELDSLRDYLKTKLRFMLDFHLSGNE